MNTPVKRNEKVPLSFEIADSGYCKVSLEYGNTQSFLFKMSDNFEVLNGFFRLSSPKLAKYTLKCSNKKIKKDMTIGDMFGANYYLVNEKIERNMDYSKLVNSVLSNVLRMYNLLSDKELYNQLEPQAWKRIRRTLCIASYSGINVCFLMDNWEKLENGLSEHIRAADYHKLKLTALRFQFDPTEGMKAYRRADCAELKGFGDSPLVKYSVELTNENLVYGDMLSILFPFRYDNRGLPEEQYRCKVIVPLITSLFRDSPYFMGVTEYKTATMGSVDSRAIDLCILPKLKDCLFPPVFVVECSAGRSPLLEKEDHKDYQRVYRICALTITKYMGIFKDWVEGQECAESAKEDLLKEKINIIKVYGCMTHNLTFQFFVAYPVYEDKKIHIVFEEPVEWRIDLTGKEEMGSIEFLQMSPGPSKFIEYEKECFTSGSVNAAELTELTEDEMDGIPEDSIPEDSDESNEYSSEPYDARKSKKRKIEKEQAPECFYDLAHLLDAPANLLVKCRFIKQFVKYSETCCLELLNSMDDLNPNAEPMAIFKDPEIGESRSNKDSNTGNRKSNVQQARDSHETPTKRKQTTTMFKDGKSYFCIVKDIGHHELSILNELRTYQSAYICQFVCAVSCDINNETKLIFEKLARVDDIAFESDAALYNTSLNYILNGLSALQVLKSLGIFHRDITPNNILVANHGTPYECFKLTDFGHSVHADKHKDSDVYGTNGFIDPQKSFSFESDLYSLGKSVECAMFSRIMQSFPDTDDTEEMMDLVARLMRRMQRKLELEVLFEEGMRGFKDFKRRFGYAHSLYLV